MVHRFSANSVARWPDAHRSRRPGLRRGRRPSSSGCSARRAASDRTDDGMPVLDFAVCAPAAGPGADRAWASTCTSSTGSDRARRRRPGRRPGDAARRRRARRQVLDAARGGVRPRRADPVGLLGRLRARARPGCSTAASAPRTGGTRDELAERYPAARVVPEVLYVDDGQVVTSAGTAAGLDARLHLWRQEYGAGVASAVARRMVVPPQRDGGQAQFIARAVPDCDAETLGPLLDWIADHLGEDLDVETLARRVADVAAHLRPPVPRRDRHDPARLGDQPAGAAPPRSCSSAPTARWSGSPTRSASATPPRCATTSRGCGASARSSTAAASPADPRSARRQAAPAAALAPGGALGDVERLELGARPRFHIESHIVVAAAGESVPARSASMSVTCISQVATAVRAARERLRVRARPAGRTRAAPAARGARGGAHGQLTSCCAASRSARWKSAIRCLAPIRVWFQKAVACCRVMAPTHQLVHRADVHLPLVHRGSGRARRAHGQRLRRARAPLQAGRAGYGVARPPSRRSRQTRPPARSTGRRGSSDTAETVTQTRPSSTNPTSAPSANACASRRSTNRRHRSDAGSASAVGPAPRPAPWSSPLRARPSSPGYTLRSGRPRRLCPKWGKCRTAGLRVVDPSGRAPRCGVLCRVRRRRGAGVTRAVDCAMMRA